MLQITKIIEGGIDLTSGERIDRGIVIHNGIQELTVPISEQSLEGVVLLYAQMVEAVSHGGNGKIRLEPEERAELGLDRPQPPMMRTADLPPPQQRAEPVVQNAASADSDYEESPPSTDLGDDGFEPGEDYADSGTGVGSL